MKFLKILAKTILIIVILMAILFLVLFKKIDRTPYNQTEHYKKWKFELSNFKPVKLNSNEDFQVGWSKVNITPPAPGPMAGYGNRRGKFYESVHDSVFVRVISIKNQNKEVFLLSADLLIIPPNVTTLLYKKLDSLGMSKENFHLSATHTHNSIGGWGETITGKLFAGKYNPEIENFLVDKFLEAILNSKKNQIAARIIYAEAVDNEDIRNRLGLEGGKVDPEIRTLLINRKDGSRGHLVSYGAHSTILDSQTMLLSRDYSGVLVDSLEKNRVQFAIFMAGAVGSMGPVPRGNDDFDELNNQAMSIIKKLPNVYADSLEISDLQSYSLSLPLRKPNPKIFKNWGLRSWVFDILFGKAENNISITKINNTLMIGLPCDFSGELMANLDLYAKQKGLDLIVTGFNGGYIGYVTDDAHFDKELYETTTMAWYGYQNGAYFSEIIRDIIDKMAYSN